MNKLILGLILGITISAPILAKTIINPIEFITTSYDGFRLTTTKITTEEGTYRIFMLEEQNGYGKGAGITAIKIK